MADRVIVVGLRRGGSLIPASELKQLMGRAGRNHQGEGVVELVVHDSDEGAYEDMVAEGASSVFSSLSDEDILATSIMPEICRGEVDSIESAMVWVSRGFCSDPPVSKALELLKEVEAIKEKDGRIVATPIGECAARYYFHPADVYSWWCNFKAVFDLGLEREELAAACALGSVPFDRIVGDLGDSREVATQCRQMIPFGMRVMKGSLVNVVCWWYLMGGPSIGPLRLSVLERRRGFGRYLSVLRELDKVGKWGMGQFFDNLEVRVKKGIGLDLLPLCRLPGINKTRAQYLFDIGVRERGDFKAIVDKLSEEIDDDFKSTIRIIARGTGKEGN